jgi:hypothetical protein
MTFLLCWMICSISAIVARMRAFPCGSPMLGELVVSRRPKNHWSPLFVKRGAECRLSQSAASGISMPPITNNL